MTVKFSFAAVIFGAYGAAVNMNFTVISEVFMSVRYITTQVTCKVIGLNVGCKRAHGFECGVANMTSVEMFFKIMPLQILHTREHAFTYDTAVAMGLSMRDQFIIGIGHVITVFTRKRVCHLDVVQQDCRS